jgi:hypothetical protein
MTNPSSGSSSFSSPTGGESTSSDENAGVQFDAPSEGTTEQAAFTAAPEAMTAGLSAQLLDARSSLEDALRQQATSSGVQSIEAATSDVGMIQGVGIGLGEPGSGVPGEPTLAVFVTESTSSIDQIRSVVVDGLGVQAAGDLPISVHASGPLEAQSHRFRIRPAPGGVSVAHFKVTAGTIGCLSLGRTAPRNSRLMILSNNHVLGNSNNSVFGDCICQPGPYDGGKCPADQIAILERFVPLKFGGPTNYVDCATGWCWPDRVRRELLYLSNGAVQLFRISSQAQYPRLGQIVGKTGRTTQLKSGRVVALNWSGWVGYGSPGRAWFAGQFVVQGTSGDFSAGGDSGSSVWTWDSTRNPVGLLFAGGGGYTICNPMPWVLSALDINLYT